ncbi:MAG: glycosyltransferase [Rhodocyclaceae bacterium]|nr:glycosyltransferase [Rhodocyclaceae bacterium]
MDADGQHRPEDIPRLLTKLEEGYDMAVGARGMQDHAGAHRDSPMPSSTGWPAGW